MELRDRRDRSRDPPAGTHARRNRHWARRHQLPLIPEPGAPQPSANRCPRWMPACPRLSHTHSQCTTRSERLQAASTRARSGPGAGVASDAAPAPASRAERRSPAGLRSLPERGLPWSRDGRSRPSNSGSYARPVRGSACETRVRSLWLVGVGGQDPSADLLGQLDLGPAGSAGRWRPRARAAAFDWTERVLYSTPVLAPLAGVAAAPRALDGAGRRRSGQEQLDSELSLGTRALSAWRHRTG